MRNYQARNFMREMRLGDLGFFYHSQSDKAVVGIVEVFKEAHPDSTTDDPRWECVDIKAIEPLKTAVTLEMIKTDPRLRRNEPCQKFALVQSSPSKQKNGKLFAH